eukprot:TRINITY_DN1334_c0_g6_i1.p1 TRINITY_DN1334_c0_g6~~TRINITY_DN1334_c0_g6_i1.p1  ORF type:complete len:305 (-),score=51.09 TRINITY_DN1334_c0_g6_i1:177-1091(-)
MSEAISSSSGESSSSSGSFGSSLSYQRWVCVREVVRTAETSATDSSSSASVSCSICENASALCTLAASFNFCFSILADGELAAIRADTFADLGFLQPKKTVSDSSFKECKLAHYSLPQMRGNQVVISFFHQLCSLSCVQGQAGFYWKSHGVCKTLNDTQDDALQYLRKGLKRSDIALVLHDAAANKFYPILSASDTDVTLGSMTAPFSSLMEGDTFLRLLNNPEQPLSCILFFRRIDDEVSAAKRRKKQREVEKPSPILWVGDQVEKIAESSATAPTSDVVNHLERLQSSDSPDSIIGDEKQLA